MKQVRHKWILLLEKWKYRKNCRVGLVILLFQYPDAPNLFSNVRRPYRPSISTVFRRGWLTHVIGFFMVMIGSGLLVWNEVCIDNYFRYVTWFFEFFIISNKSEKEWNNIWHIIEANSYDDKSFGRRSPFNTCSWNNLCCVWWK